MPRCTPRRLLLLALAVLLATGTAAPAFASSPNATGEVEAGDVNATEADSGHFTFATTNLSPTDTATTMSLPMTVNDLRGTGAGWEVFMSMTQLTCSTASTCGTATLPYPTLLNVSAACATDSTCALPRDSRTCDISPNTPVGDIALGIALCYATTGGMGSIMLTPTLTIPILANAYIGTYEATVIIGIES